MSRILLLVVLVLWMARTGAVPPSRAQPLGATLLFLGGFGLIVMLMGVWSRVLARHVSGTNLHRSVRRFSRAMHLARLLVPAWFAVGLFALGWADTVAMVLGEVSRWPVELPAACLGTLPPLLAWMGLWWAQYPADRALREQSVLIHLDENLPVHTLPGFASYFASNLRLQVLFTLVPVLLILLLRDLTCALLWRWGLVTPVLGPAGHVELPGHVEISVSLGALAMVFLLAPEILRRVLKTQPLPASALRNRLEAMCRRSGLKYRDILLWHTESNMGNAAVMGILPRVRYILLSDLLLETMTDQQIEAVFAHEVGHVVHRHMAWYAVFLLIILGGMLGPGQWISDYFGSTSLSQGNVPAVMNLLTVVAACGGFFLLFGCLSRWFERQADVYAARTMQRYDSTHAAAAHVAPAPVDPRAGDALEARQRGSYVGRYGAELFVSALHRVAVINNIPLEHGRPWAGGIISRLGAALDALVERANNWFHGSIPKRMEYLRLLSTDPARTSRFDRTMMLLYISLMLALVCCGAGFAVTALA